MRPTCSLIRRSQRQLLRHMPRRHLLTLSIETSCDDTSVAVLEKHNNNSATLHFNSKITSDNRSFGGIHPIVAHESHQKNLAKLVNDALQKLPIEDVASHKTILVTGEDGTYLRRKPDFVTVTRGPGMRASLITGIDTAKGLAVAWQIPFLAVNHMEAHALTSRLVAALASAADRDTAIVAEPRFPFLTLLVSGGHTMLVHSKGLCDHKIIANTVDIAVGDTIDKCAGDILSPSYLKSADDVMYGRLLESFVFPVDKSAHEYCPPTSFFRSKDKAEHGYDWTFNVPYYNPGPGGPLSLADSFTFSGIGSAVRRLMTATPDMDIVERKAVGRIAMAVAFEHLTSRVLFALERPEIKDVSALVVSGGVASNQYLKKILRTNLDAKGFSHLKLIFPPPKFCTDNAAMIAWTGMEMYEAGWRSTWDACGLRKWSIDPNAEDGGILGSAGGWERVGTM